MILEIEVAYATKYNQLIIPLYVNKGICIKEAIILSNIISCFPEISFNNITVGIFGYLCELHHKVNNLDRIEIYRNLIYKRLKFK
jgi:putative ubiquitin-RnfH superfamily antitoxin RatB of RatAB toxin-antitoxin module